jgi:hypothetical protein
MSIFHLQTIACPSCGGEISVKMVDSANPTRHPQFRAQLLDGTFGRAACPSCGAAHDLERSVVWTDLPNRFCACVLPGAARENWPTVEEVTRRTLGRVLRDEGPDAVRRWGRGVRLRVVFSLVELREKVLCADNSVDDGVVECLKLQRVDIARGVVPNLEEIVPQRCITLTSSRVPWDEYETALGGRAELAAQLPGLFGDSLWVHWSRAPVPSQLPTGAA